MELIQPKTIALIESKEPEDALDYSDLSPDECHTVDIDRTIDSCKRFHSASLKVQGKRGNDYEYGDYRYAWDFLQIFVKRPCKITSKVKSCTVDSTGEDCKDYIVPFDDCNTVDDITSTFEYCNNKETDFQFKTDQFKALVETEDVTTGLVVDLSDLPGGGECRTFSTATRPINTCKKFFSASL